MEQCGISTSDGLSALVEQFNVNSPVGSAVTLLHPYNGSVAHTNVKHPAYVTRDGIPAVYLSGQVGPWELEYVTSG